MNYDVSKLMERAGCKIVIVDDIAMSRDLERSILSGSPKYKNGIHEVFYSHKKIGPFLCKNKKSLWDILIKSDAARKHGAEFLMDQMYAMELYQYDKRIPAAVSPLQTTKASVLYNALNGARSFLINDCFVTDEKGGGMQTPKKEPFLPMISWLKSYGDRCGEPFDLIWISNMSEQKLAQSLGDEEFASPFYSVHKVIGNKVTYFEKGSLDKDFQRRRDANAAFNEARNYDGFFRTALPNYLGKDNLKKAFELYKIAAEAGHPSAQFGLGELYRYGHEACRADEEKALYWYAMAAFNKEYHESTADSILKESHSLAQMRLKHMVVQIPNGRELLRSYVGNQAETLIKEAESEAKIQNILDRTGPLRDQEVFNQKMKSAVKRKL